MDQLSEVTCSRHTLRGTKREKVLINVCNEASGAISGNYYKTCCTSINNTPSEYFKRKMDRNCLCRLWRTVSDFYDVKMSVVV